VAGAPSWNGISAGLQNPLLLSMFLLLTETISKRIIYGQTHKSRKTKKMPFEKFFDRKRSQLRANSSYSQQAASSLSPILWPYFALTSFCKKVYRFLKLRDVLRFFMTVFFVTFSD